MDGQNETGREFEGDSEFEGEESSAGAETESEFDAEPEGEEPTGAFVTLEIAPGGKGLIASKSQICAITGRSPPTIDRWIREGAPVIARGHGRTPWKINTAAFQDWIERRAVMVATGGDDEDATGIQSAKRRERMAVANLREMEAARLSGKTITIDQVVTVYGEELGVIRSLLLSMAGRLGQTIANALFSPDSAGQVQEIIEADVAETMGNMTGQDSETWNVRPGE